MMYELEGGNKAQRKVVDAAMSQVINLLNIPNNVHVDITLGSFRSHGVIQDSKRLYEIEICKDVPAEEIVYAVFHEMKHVEQMVSGKLVHKGRTTVWEGEDHTLTEYFDRPWEKEAYIFEKNANLMLTSCVA